MSPSYRQFEHTLAWHCAPSLAGLKPADLLAWDPPEREWPGLLGHYVSALGGQGVRLRVLGRHRGRLMLLVYRPQVLSSWLERPAVAEMLSRLGYPAGEGLQALLRHLSRRLERGPFPHEIGLFLGYPPGDVAGFLRDGGRGCKLCGPWKVYGDVEQARRRFLAFRRCRADLSLRLAQGMPLCQAMGA